MRRVAMLGALTAAVVLVIACTADDDIFRQVPAYSYDAATIEPTRPAAPTMNTPGISCGASADLPPRVMIVNDAPPELAAVNLDTFAVDGRLLLDGGATLTSTTAFDPWLVDPANDVVLRLDAREPWRALGRWDVHGTDALPGDTRPAAPIAVVQVSCTKAYVLRANRNRIAIIDPSQPTETPTGFIDLGPSRSAGGAGAMAPAAMVFVPAKQKIFVLAGNLEGDRMTPGGSRGCKDVRSSVIGIDVTRDTVVSLAGPGVGGAIELDGYATSALVYDAPFDRLVTMSTGCMVIDGGTSRRRIEQVDLATGAVKLLLDLDDQPEPTGFALVDGDHAAVVFKQEAHLWNPRTPTLGRAIDGGLDRIANDGRGAFIGVRTRGGKLELVSVPLGDAGASSVVLKDPFTTAGGSAVSLEPWPHR